MKTIHKIIPAFALILAFSVCKSQSYGQTVLLKKNWTIQSSAKVSEDGSTLSKPGIQTNEWIPATMPSTIFNALVEAGVEKDPYYGNNLVESKSYYNVHALTYLWNIPAGNPFSVPWWFRTEFDVEESQDDYYWLEFSSINYKANIWLNGVLIADTAEIEGVHRTYQLDVSNEINKGGKNVLALQITPPIKGTDLSVRWMQGSVTMPDKNSGIWYDVKLIKNKTIKIRYPHIITKLNLPDTTQAFVTISADLYNNSDNAVMGNLLGNITPVNNIAEGGTSTGGNDKYNFSIPVNLAPNETKRVMYTVSMENPNLWWPYMSGRQSLYDLDMQVKLGNDVISDKNVTRFGVREVSSTLEDFFPEVNQKLVRIYQINGKNVFIKGGNWTQTVMMEENPERNEAEIQNMLNLNFNAIRTEGFWGSDHFYDLCDKYGIMIFDGFNCCSIWERWDVWTDRSYEIAGLSFRDQIIRKRNHPSFVNWLLASDNHVPFRAEKLYTKIVEEFDGTRPYQSNSMYSTTPFCGCTGLDHDPYPQTYMYLHPTVWYGKKDKMKSEWGDDYFGPYEFLEFNTEVGPGGEQIPPIESVRSMMYKKDWWPINETWKIRQSSDGYSYMATDAFNYRYGKPDDLESYTARAQVYQKETYRTMAESYRKNKYAASGILIYRLNAGWPSLCYFLYDYYLRPNGAYTAIQQAFEPLHVLYAYDDSSIVVSNDLYKGFQDLKVTARLMNFDMTEKFAKTETFDIGKDINKKVFHIPRDIKGLSDIYFLSLKLEDENNKLLSSNFYWLSTTYDTLAQYTGLEDLPTSRVNASAKYSSNGKNSLFAVTITNPTDKLAFFINPQILKGIHGDELLPSYWDAKYFSLLPNETREISVRFDNKDLEGRDPYLMVEGWNIDPIEIEIRDNKNVTPSLVYGDVILSDNIQMNKPFEVSISVKNSAESGDALLKSRQYLLVDGVKQGFKRIALSPGEEKQLVWFDVIINSPGKHTIQIGDSKKIEIKVAE
jgi:exo-1,4-beta-D-glucosaminidase